MVSQVAAKPKNMPFCVNSLSLQYATLQNPSVSNSDLEERNILWVKKNIVNKDFGGNYFLSIAIGLVSKVSFPSARVRIVGLQGPYIVDCVYLPAKSLKSIIIQN